MFQLAVSRFIFILGGKLVASLIGSLEVDENFKYRYGDLTGVISGKNKNAQLALVIICSAYGRSSVYNRLKITNAVAEHQVLVELKSIGYTRGYGYYQFSESLFNQIKSLLIKVNHPYVRTYDFGQGSNWRFRIIREGLKLLDLNQNLLLHGIQREVFAMPMGDNARDFLIGKDSLLNDRRLSVDRISALVMDRWVIPRAKRFPEFKNFRREKILDLMLWNTVD